jgi:hypothetical protein
MNSLEVRGLTAPSASAIPALGTARDEIMYAGFQRLNEISGGKIRYFEDFLGDVAPDEVNSVEGTDTTTAAQAVLAGALGGVFRLTTGDVGNYAADASIINGGSLQWKASQDLVMRARIKPSAIAAMGFFVGFTDILTIEAPFTVGGSDALTSNASDGCGVVFDTGATTDVMWAVGVKADTDGTKVNIGAPVAAVWHDLEIRVSVTGTMTMYLNGTLVATVPNAVTPTTALTWTIQAWALTTTPVNLDIDYVEVVGNREA